MATSSITNNIVLTDEKDCIRLLDALEEAKNAIPKKVEFQKEVVTLQGSEIKKFLHRKA